MARINNLSVYGMDNMVTLDDFVIGTDADQNGKTKNFSIASFILLMNEVNGNSSMTFKFSDGTLLNSNEELYTPQDQGLMFSEGNVTDPEAVTKFIINRNSIEGLPVGEFFQAISQTREHFVFNIFKPSSKDVFFYFKVKGITLTETNVELAVEIADQGYLGRLENDITYSFKMDAVGGSGTTIVKTSELENDGNDGENPFITAEDIKEEVEVLDRSKEGVEGVIYVDKGEFKFYLWDDDTEGYYPASGDEIDYEAVIAALGYTPADETQIPDNTSELINDGFDGETPFKSEPKVLSFEPVVSLDKDYSIEEHQVSGAIEYTFDKTKDNKIFKVREDILIADGLNKPRFSDDFEVVWDNYKNEQNVKNYIHMKEMGGVVKVHINYIR